MLNEPNGQGKYLCVKFHQSAINPSARSSRIPSHPPLSCSCEPPQKKAYPLLSLPHMIGNSCDCIWQGQAKGVDLFVSPLQAHTFNGQWLQVIQASETFKHHQVAPLLSCPNRNLKVWESLSPNWGIYFFLSHHGLVWSLLHLALMCR